MKVSFHFAGDLLLFLHLEPRSLSFFELLWSIPTSIEKANGRRRRFFVCFTTVALTSLSTLILRSHKSHTNTLTQSFRKKSGTALHKRTRHCTAFLFFLKVKANTLLKKFNSIQCTRAPPALKTTSSRLSFLKMADHFLFSSSGAIIPHFLAG